MNQEVPAYALQRDPSELHAPRAESTFHNPLTDTQYRLYVQADNQTWRITKSATTDGQTVIRHLRGTHAAMVTSIADAAIDALIRGVYQTVTFPGDPRLSFADTILLDIDRTANLLTTLALEARVRRTHSSPGFRPGCPTLRELERQAMIAAVHGCQTLGIV